MKIIIPPNMDGEVYLPLLSEKYEVIVDGRKLKISREKKTPFISLGNISSGTHSIRMVY